MNYNKTLQRLDKAHIILLDREDVAYRKYRSGGMKALYTAANMLVVMSRYHIQQATFAKDQALYTRDLATRAMWQAMIEQHVALQEKMAS